MYYTYAHIRPDTGNVFYIGKGSKKRAYSKNDRNPHWRHVVKNNKGEFIVKILNWFNNEDDALVSEIWQISELKASNFLVNITPGGEKPPIVRMFGSSNPMKNPDVSAKAKETAKKIRETEEYREKLSRARTGKGTGNANAMCHPDRKGIFAGLNNSMSKYSVREKHYSENKTIGSKNGMFGKCGDKNPAYGKPSAMRGKNNLGVAWVAANKTWQNYWGA